MLSLLGCGGLAQTSVYMRADRLPRMQDKAEPCLTPQGKYVSTVPMLVMIWTMLAAKASEMNSM